MVYGVAVEHENEPKTKDPRFAPSPGILLLSYKANWNRGYQTFTPVIKYLRDQLQLQK